MAVNLVNKDQVELTLRFRVFDDGVGFRYEYNVPAADSLLITDELTTFRFRQDGTSWSIPASAETYELLYAQRPISEPILLSPLKLPMASTEVFMKRHCTISRK